ncbi:MAG TPA: sigma-70 family RNA polymerase sigma factor [Candidatus Margulisiibacteriota bacterium]|nr:sigma-70 family RNA polymerase sigma factor [Candidatus Margulisiibacteriota bacterium]
MSDLDFVQSCVSHDEQAWDEFLKKYSRLIYSYIHSVLRSKGSTLPQEQLQDIFQELVCALIKDDFRKLKSFQAKNGCSLASWLRQVTINFTIDYLRKLKTAVSLDEENEEGFSLQDVLADSSLPVSDRVNQEELSMHLAECIEALETKDKYFLQLHINQGLRLEALRGHFNLSRGAIDMYKARILERLRQCFKRKGLFSD